MSMDEETDVRKNDKKITQKEIIARCAKKRLDMLTEETIVGMFISSYTDIEKYIDKEKS